MPQAITYVENEIVAESLRQKQLFRRAVVCVSYGREFAATNLFGNDTSNINGLATNNYRCSSQLRAAAVIPLILK